MLFNSFQYLGFFLATLAISWILAPWRRLRIWFLVLGSFYFYFSNNGWAIVLLLLCMQIDYFAGIYIERSVSRCGRKWILGVSLFSNLAILGFFKYLNFFVSVGHRLMAWIGYGTKPWIVMSIALPVGISFYTFESMSYSIDVYRKHIKAERFWSRYALFVSYFPHLISGPILRPGDFLPQLEKRPQVDGTKIDHGLYLIATGLFKKMVLADFLASVVDQFYGGGFKQAGFLEAWIIVSAFSFQIYFDFSGYTDIAIGCAKLMGFEIPDNFRRPYASQSVSDFWRRWHISLSSWLRDYLYIPLGGSRGSKAMVYRNLLITMALGGLWHGAAWHFVLWGMFQGILLVIERAFHWNVTDYERSSRLRALFRSGCIFLLVSVGWVLFRGESVSNIKDIFATMVHFSGFTLPKVQALWVVEVVIGAWLWQNLCENWSFEQIVFRTPMPVKIWAYAVLVVVMSATSSPVARPFIYFKF